MFHLHLKIATTLTLFIIGLAQQYAQEKEFIVQSGHSSQVNCLEFSEKGDVFASAGLDNNVVLWEMESGKQLRLFSGHNKKINDLQFIHHDSILASCSDDSTIKFWDTYTGKLLFQTKTTFLPTSISYDKINRHFFAAAKIVYQVDLSSGELSTIKSPKRRAYDRVFSLNNNTLIFGSSKALHHYIYDEDKVIKKKTGSVNLLKVSPDNSSYAISTKNGNILTYRIGPDKNKMFQTLRTGFGSAREVKALAYTNDKLLYLGKDNSSTLINCDLNRTEKVFLTNYYKAEDLAIHPNGQQFITGANDGKIYLWDIASGVLVREFKSNSSSINFAKFSNDGSSIVLGYNNGLIRVWDLAYGGTLRTHKFQLPNNQLKKGWKYEVLSLTNQENDTYSFKIALTKPYPGTIYFKECRYYDFVWNLETNEKKFTEKYVDNFEYEQAKFDDIVDKSNRKFQNDTLFIITNGTKVDEFINDKPKNHGFQTPHSNDLTSVDYNTEKRLYLTTSWDGKILLYNQSKKLIAYLVALGVDDFIIANTDNYYYATKGALNFVGLTKGHESGSFQQFDLLYNRPDKVYSEIPFSDTTTIKMLASLHEKRLERSHVYDAEISENAKPPIVTLKSLTGPVSNDGNAQVQIAAQDEYGLKNFSLTIDGVPVYKSGKSDFLRHKLDTTLVVKLQSGINKLEFSADNIKNISALSKFAYIKYDSKIGKPDLYFVGIGAGEFQDTLRNLKYAAKDIQDIEKTLKKSKIFNKTKSLTFYGSAVHKDSISSINDFIADAKVSDVVIMYYAGHGLLNKDLDYYLATYNNDFLNPEENGIPYEDFEHQLAQCQSRKKLLFLDACHSGELDKSNLVIKEGDVIIGEDIKFRNSGSLNAYEQGESLDALKAIFADLKESNGITVISSAGGADYAIESDLWENGAFTHCLIDGLKSGKTDLDANGATTVSDLLLYLQINVPLLTNGYQVPTYRTENIENDFVIWKRK